MHGIVFAELQKYAETKHGAGTWHQLLTRAGLGNKLYFPVQEYPDSEIASLVRAASEMTGQPNRCSIEGPDVSDENLISLLLSFDRASCGKHCGCRRMTGVCGSEPRTKETTKG